MISTRSAAVNVRHNISRPIDVLSHLPESALCLRHIQRDIPLFCLIARSGVCVGKVFRAPALFIVPFVMNGAHLCASSSPSRSRNVISENLHYFRQKLRPSAPAHPLPGPHLTFIHHNVHGVWSWYAGSDWVLNRPVRWPLKLDCLLK